MGRGKPERGAAQHNQHLLSPALSSLLRREEREKSPPYQVQGENSPKQNFAL